VCIDEGERTNANEQVASKGFAQMENDLRPQLNKITKHRHTTNIFKKATNSSSSFHTATRMSALLCFRRIYSRPVRNLLPRDSSSSSFRLHQHQHHRHLASTPDDRSVSDRLRDRYHERSQALRHTVDDRREKIRHRATHYRDSAAVKLKEFQDNPKQTALAGAKSFTAMLRMYGPVFIGTYGVVYLTTLSTLYAGVASGVVDPVALFTTLNIIPTAVVDAAATAAVDAGATIGPTTTVDLVYNFLDRHEITKAYAHYVQDYPALANFGVAWIAVKFTEPIRLPVAISITPRVARYIGYRPQDKDSNNKAAEEHVKKDESSSSSSSSNSSSSSSSP
jgi:hypothetical protein